MLDYMGAHFAHTRVLFIHIKWIDIIRFVVVASYPLICTLLWVFFLLSTETHCSKRCCDIACTPTRPHAIAAEIKLRRALTTSHANDERQRHQCHDSWIMDD